MEVRADPGDGLVDELPSVSVTGLDDEATVELELSTVDADGHRWRSRGERYDERLFWEMEFASEDRPPTAFVAPSTRSGRMRSPCIASHGSGSPPCDHAAVLGGRPFAGNACQTTALSTLSSPASRAGCTRVPCTCSPPMRPR